MANLQDFTVSRFGTTTVSNFPRYRIEGRIEDVNPDTGQWEDIANYTGANAIIFPAELVNRTPEERDFLLTILSRLLIEMKAGLWMGP